MSNNLICGFGALSYWMPAAVDYAMSARLPRYIPLSMRATYDNLRADGWRFYVTNVRHGYCHQDKKVITIPLAVLGQPVEHVAYMLAHEMAHGLCQMDDPAHGVEFLANFLAIAPKNLWYLEPAYTRTSQWRERDQKKLFNMNPTEIKLTLVPTQKEMMS